MTRENRYKTITVLPVLIPTDNPREADGTVIVPKGYPDLTNLPSTFVRIVPAEALHALGNRRSRIALEQHFGAIDSVRWEKALASLALREAVRLESGEERKSYEQHTFRAWKPIHQMATLQGAWSQPKAALDKVAKDIVAGRSEEKLAALIADLDRSCNLVLWRGKGRNNVYRVGVYVWSLAAAIEMLIALRLAEPPAMVICKGCKKPFEYTNRKRKYCTDACGNRARVRKSRRKG